MVGESVRYRLSGTVQVTVALLPATPHTEAGFRVPVSSTGVITNVLLFISLPKRTGVLGMG